MTDSKGILNDVVGHISRSSSKLGSVKSIKNNNTFDINQLTSATAKTSTAKADVLLHEESVQETEPAQKDEEDYSDSFQRDRETPQQLSETNKADEETNKANEEKKEEEEALEQEIPQPIVDLQFEEIAYSYDGKVPESLHEMSTNRRKLGLVNDYGKPLNEDIPTDKKPRRKSRKQRNNQSMRLSHLDINNPTIQAYSPSTFHRNSLNATAAKLQMIKM